MKKLLLFMTIILSLGLAACGSKDVEVKQETKEPSELEQIKKQMNDHREEIPKEETKKEVKQETFVISDEAKKMAIEQVTSNPLVKDAHIEVKGKEVTMSVIVNDAVTKESAKQIGDNFVRNLGGFAGGKGPEKNYYGEVFDNYDLRGVVGTSADNVIIHGYKATSSNRINW
ncbi:hypothetical protein [Bacillus sp. COPE52]|uniref:hypothetical protein n=1 Tax=Bacillus sp. COPE52 TaxID=2233998 RepID=UPI000E109473|nr:hypothetical protein [Bacillus sp. COPE52]AXK19116.1 hypothetical protein DPQ31_16020 [Bacillus sp. COPE52]